MNPIISNELNLFAQELQYFLSPVGLQEIAKQVGFVQRSSKYQANELITPHIMFILKAMSYKLGSTFMLENITY